MPVSLIVPGPLRPYVGGLARVEVVADTIAGAIAALIARHPEVRKLLLDESGKLSGFVELYLGGRSVRDLGTTPEAVALKDGDDLRLVLSAADGVAEPHLSHEEILRYSRHLLMPEVTLEGQKRLKRAKVLCVGAGGLGSPLMLYLAAAGVGTIGIVDFDTVDISNLQRQILYGSSDVGRQKLQATKERLKQLNPAIDVVTHGVRLTSSNALELLGGYDVVADGTDNFDTRYLVNDACVLLGKPNVYASVFRFEGQLSVFDAAHGPCYRCLFPEPPPAGLVPSCSEGGVLGVLPGILGSLQALEVLKLILGKGDPLVGRLVTFDALAFRFRELSVRKDPACAVCGLTPTITMPIDQTAWCRPEDDGTLDAEGEAVEWIEVEEFDRLRRTGEQLILLDVREPHEFEIARIPGAMAFPLSELPLRLRELDVGSSYTVHCHKSTRSRKAYQVMRKAGFHRVQVLSGGIDAWAERIDSSLPRY